MHGQKTYYTQTLQTQHGVISLEPPEHMCNMLLWHINSTIIAESVVTVLKVTSRYFLLTNTPEICRFFSWSVLLMSFCVT